MWVLTGGLLPWLACPFKKQAVITIRPVLPGPGRGFSYEFHPPFSIKHRASHLSHTTQFSAVLANVLHSWLHMFEAAKQAFVHFLGPLSEPWTRDSEAIVCSCRKLCIFNQRALPWSFKVKGIHRWPTCTNMRSHARRDTQMQPGPCTCATSSIFGSPHPWNRSSTSRFTVTSQRSWGEGSGQWSANNDAGAPFSSSQLQHMDIHPVTQLRTQIDKHTSTFMLSKCMHSHTHWRSWPLLGPHVVGVFSYGAESGNRESERQLWLGDKRWGGPRVRVKEALGLALDLGVLKERTTRCSNRRYFVEPFQYWSM